MLPIWCAGTVTPRNTGLDIATTIPPLRTRSILALSERSRSFRYNCFQMFSIMCAFHLPLLSTSIHTYIVHASERLLVFTFLYYYPTPTSRGFRGITVAHFYQSFTWEFKANFFLYHYFTHSWDGGRLIRVTECKGDRWQERERERERYRQIRGSIFVYTFYDI